MSVRSKRRRRVERCTPWNLRRFVLLRASGAPVPQRACYFDCHCGEHLDSAYMPAGEDYCREHIEGATLDAGLDAADWTELVGDVERDSIVWCSTCDVPLQSCLTDYGADAELAYWEGRAAPTMAIEWREIMYLVESCAIGYGDDHPLHGSEPAPEECGGWWIARWRRIERIIARHRRLP